MDLKYTLLIHFVTCARINEIEIKSINSPSVVLCIYKVLNISSND